MDEDEQVTKTLETAKSLTDSAEDAIVLLSTALMVALVEIHGREDAVDILKGMAAGLEG